MGREKRQSGVSSYSQIFVETFSTRELIAEDNRLAHELGERQVDKEERIARATIRKDIIMANIEHKNAKLWGGKASIALHFRHDIELIAYLRFDNLCEAQMFVEQVIGNYDSELKDEDTLLIRKGWIIVKCDPKSTASVEDIMNYKPTKDEAKRTLDIANRRVADNISQYHWGSHPDVHKKTMTDDEREALGFRVQKVYSNETEQVKKTGRELAAVKENRDFAKKDKAEKKPRASKDGLTTLAEICTTLKIDPRDARAALRAAKIDKPDAGWAWANAKAAPDIEAIVKKWRKK